MNKKKVLITGASRGLGMAIAKKLAGAYTLVLHASKPENFADTDPDHHYLYADFSNPEQLRSFCKQLKAEHGNDLYAVINNAGLTFDKSLIYQPEQDIDIMLNVNLKAPIMICKTAMKIFNLNKRGVIINISSVVGETGNAFQAVYSATKAGLTALSKSLAQEAAALHDTHEIRVLTVSPGFIETDMVKSIKEADKQKIIDRIPAKKIGNTNHVASTVAFLLSDEAAYINASNIPVNGGMI